MNLSDLRRISEKNKQKTFSARKILIEGNVKRVSREKSTDYFNSRPLLSRASASVSHQSTTIDSLETLKNQRDKLLLQPDKIQCPERWGGFALHATRIECWQGGMNRLHSRVVYHKKNGGWTKSLLAP